MLRNMKVKTILMTAISAAVLSACGGGGSSPSTELVNNAIGARSVMDKVEALKPTEELTAADADEVSAVIAAYNQLPNDSKQLVNKTTLDKLKAAQEAVKKAAEGSQSVDDSVIRAADSVVDALKKQIAELPESATEINNETKEKQLIEAQKAFNALSEQQKTLITTVEKSKLAKLSDQLVTDHSPLPALNLPTPLHTDFIESAAAQQNNPNIQLRKIDGQNDFRTDQGGLISSLASNANQEVKIDGVVINNSTTTDNATTVNFTTPYSMIAKAYSGGISKEDVSEQIGQDKNTIFAVGKSSIDNLVVERFKSLKASKDDLEAAKRQLETAKNNLANPQTNTGVLTVNVNINNTKDDVDKDKTAQETMAELKAKVTELEEKIDGLQYSYKKIYQDRQNLSVNTKNTANNIAYTKKDKNGLVIDKKFDGVYIVQFIDGTRIVMHDPAAAGWTYQTFAHYVDPKNGVIHGYQTVGDETAFGTMPATGTATYNGLTTAYLVEGSQQKQLTADVKAVVDFAKKGVRFETANSQIHSLNNGVRTSSAAATYNIKGNAAWGNTNHFVGNAQTANGLKGDLNGKFYGANAAEIGGTYGLKNSANTEQLIGGYGAKRQ